MISITVNTDKVMSVLSSFADKRMLDQLSKTGAASYTQETLKWIKDGHAFTRRTKGLENSIDWRFLGNGAAEVSAMAKYARYVEFGTKPHVIRPKPGNKALKIPNGRGGFFFARKVNHPGSKPYPYFFADRPNRIQSMKKDLVSVLRAHAKL